MPAPIEVHALTKSYGELDALKGVDFEVREGEVFGLLGPNGAGKTSTVEILEGLRPRSGGSVTVLGLDPSAHSLELRDRIGVCLQSTNLPDKMRVREALETFGELYSHHAPQETLLKLLKLEEKKDAFYSTLSGGQKQRLALALALVNEPQVLFLDEPTAGLDPQVRLEIHTLVQSLREQKRTVLLTTHYIEEAEKLCDRIAIIDGGRIIAHGTPREIRSRAAGQSSIDIVLAAPLTVPMAEPGDGAVLTVSADGRLLHVTAAKPARALVTLLKALDAAGVEIEDIQMKRPTLEDAFIELTGQRLRE